MQLVVSDTSPLVALSRSGLLGFLPTLYQTVLIPPSVLAELASHVDVREVERFVFVRAPRVTAGRVLRPSQLDQGEWDAIQLALEVHADAVLIDESARRAYAQQQSLSVVGFLGILLIAKRVGRVASIGHVVRQLMADHKYFVGAQLLRKVLQTAGEVESS